ncbi:MAG TPA: hypothetical protein PLO44_00900 [Candidatus Paceibacterota bacterium]|nr:hypothetical protein [Candidatus Paceibacterota bacterium]
MFNFFKEKNISPEKKSHNIKNIMIKMLLSGVLSFGTAEAFGQTSFASSEKPNQDLLKKYQTEAQAEKEAREILGQDVYEMTWEDINKFEKISPEKLDSTFHETFGEVKNYFSAQKLDSISNEKGMHIEFGNIEFPTEAELNQPSMIEGKTIKEALESGDYIAYYIPVSIDGGAMVPGAAMALLYKEGVTPKFEINTFDQEVKKEINKIYEPGLYLAPKETQNKNKDEKHMQATPGNHTTGNLGQEIYRLLVIYNMGFKQKDCARVGNVNIGQNYSYEKDKEPKIAPMSLIKDTKVGRYPSLGISTFVVYKSSEPEIYNKKKRN